VRAELARALAFSERAPPVVILGLAVDQPQIASWVLEHSPLLLDADLVDTVATGDMQIQTAIANRRELPCSVAAAIAEVGMAEACLVLMENQSSQITAFSFDRVAARYGHLGAVREAMLQRNDLPAPTRQALVAKLSQTLAGFVVAREWLAPGRAERVLKEACEKATVTLAATSPEPEMRLLIRHLRESGQLSAGLMLRALLCGNLEMFLQSLAELSGLPISRVSALVLDRGSAGLRAAFDAAGLPVSSFPGFREAINALREAGFDPDGDARLKRRMVERVLTRCADEPSFEAAPLLTLLRRFAAEAAREEAQVFCHELVEDELDSFEQRIAA
jgi:uncharacterized protein (DUF2336 family)